LLVEPRLRRHRTRPPTSCLGFFFYNALVSQYGLNQVFGMLKSPSSVSNRYARVSSSRLSENGDGWMIKVGCCGFPIGMKQYFEKFRLVEIQSTFYRIPKLKTVAGWKNRAGEDFEFSVKAWQAITHPPTSPTWKRAQIKADIEDRGRYGFFRPTREVFEAWEKTREICNLLGARICLIQCPSSFVAEEQNVRNMREFFSKIDREGLILAWEPRGQSWSDAKVKQLCEELDLTHCVDPFAANPIFTDRSKIAYFRLHGRPPGRTMYCYKYTDEDLRWLTKKAKDLEADGLTVCCLFNNISMDDDAKRFTRLIKTSSAKE
jgi:uncharacterized protein YecE (DUF72 family)